MELKKISRILITILSAVVIAGSLSLSNVNAAEIVTSEIEQIYANMPEIKVYLPLADKDSISAENVTGYLGDKSMSCEDISVFSDTKDNVDYYVLFDISTSIKPDIFQDMKNSVISFEKKLSENDKFTFITFGTEVNTLYTSSDKTKNFSDVMSNLKNDNISTSLYSALSYVAKLADSNSNDQYRRKECILITDGYDEAVGKETMNETKAQLLKYNIPVYSICTIYNETTVQEKLGELSRLTGGNIKFLKTSNTCIELMDEIVSEINNTLVLSFNANNNIVDNSEHQFALKFTDKNITKTKNVFLSHYQPDNTKPEIKRIKTDGTNRIKVYFSEDVLNAAVPGNYIIINSNDEAVGAKSVTYEKVSDEYVASLTFENSIITDDYSISCKNIYDNSMERNEVSNTVKEHLDGAEPPNAFVEFIKSWWWIFLIILVLIIAAVFAAVFIKFTKKRAVVVVNDEAVLKENVLIEKKINQSKQYNVQIKETNVVEKSHLFVKIILSSGESQNIDLEIGLSIVVGRSKLCGLCIEDPHISRQHFAIEKVNNSFYITDLNSTSGTSLNGVKIQSRRKLEKNDVISAGTVKFQVNWN